MKEVPVLFSDRHQCCGCSACASSCPANAISMTLDAEGFLYPQIDESLCLRCGKCVAVCAFKKRKPDKERIPNSFAFRHPDESLRTASQSGGAFSIAARMILSYGGVVYGVVLDDSFKAVFERVEDEEHIVRLHGSKYIQAEVGDAYRRVKKDLEEGRRVLFSGTGCQVDGLKSFLGKDYENLFTVDIVCHGVPSPKVFHDYVGWWEKRKKARCVDVDFRNKRKFGWHSHVETLWFSDGSSISSTCFATMFYGHNIVRQSCFNCPYKNLDRTGDISIADYWGVEKVAPEFDDNKGVSLVLVNTEKGQRLVDASGLPLVATDILKSLQPPLRVQFDEPAGRQKFWDEYQYKGIDFVVRKYGNEGLEAILKKCLKKILPSGLVTTLKSMIGKMKKSGGGGIST